VDPHPSRELSPAQPSLTDEKTFQRVFGGCDWAVTAILARGGESYARLRFNTGPRAEVEISTRVDWNRPFASSDQQAWLEEYKACVQEALPLLTAESRRPLLDQDLLPWDERDLAAAFW
jgi:hypothetical protein